MVTWRTRGCLTHQTSWRHMLWTDVARHKNTNEMAPSRDLMLKMRVSKRPREEYFGTKDKMAVIVLQNLKKKTKKIYIICNYWWELSWKLQIQEMYVFNEVSTRRPLKKYWNHRYDAGDNRGILAKWLESKVKLSRGSLKPRSWSLDPTDRGLTGPTVFTLLIKIFQTQRWQHVSPSKVLNV